MKVQEEPKRICFFDQFSKKIHKKTFYTFLITTAS